MGGQQSFKQRFKEIMDDVELSDVGKLRRLQVLREDLDSQSVMRSGGGSNVRIGGDVKGSSIISGDGNNVRIDHKTSNKIDQRIHSKTRITHDND